MSLSLRIRLSLMMFLEFAIWGAWMPVIYPYLTGSAAEGGLGFAPGQATWFFGVFYLACIVAPFIGGQIVDRWLPTQWFLAAVHFGGGLLMIYMAKQKDFGPMMVAMSAYCLLFAPTIALTASLCFHHLTDADKQFPAIRVFGTIGWVVALWGLSGWRWLAERQGVLVPGDMLYVAGGCALAMGVLCCFLPNTPPKKEAGKPWAFIEATRLLRNPHFAIFMIISFVVTTQLQLYYVLHAKFLEAAVGIANKNVPAVTTVAQIAEAFVMAALLSISLKKLGLRRTLAIGVIAWPIRYVVFAFYQSVPAWGVVASMTLHGLGYTFFFVVSQIYVEKVAPPDIRGSAQALLTLVTMGIGSFLGTRFSAWVETQFTTNGVADWKSIFLVPCFLTVACALAFLLFFKEPEAAPAAAPAEEG